MFNLGKITEQQSLMLLRCTGALLVKEHPMDRLKIFTELWNELKNIGELISWSSETATGQNS